MGRTRGLSSHDAPKGAARRAIDRPLGRFRKAKAARVVLIPFFSVVGKSEGRPPKRKGQPNRFSSRDPTADCFRTLQPILQPRSCDRRFAGGCRQQPCSAVFPTTLRRSVAANTVVASAPTLRVANRVTNTALSPALLGWGLRQRGVDNPVHNASLSFV